MKKTATFLAAVFISLVLELDSCKAPPLYVPETGPFQMYYLGAMRNYSVIINMQVSTAGNYIIIRADEWTTINYITMKVTGIVPGTYTLGDSSGNYMTIYKGYSTYTTQTAGGWGTINITSVDSNSASGTFNGTVVLPQAPADSFNVTQGSFNFHLKSQN